MLSSCRSLPFTHVRKRLYLSRRSALSSHEFQLFFHVCSTDLGIANGCLDGWGPFHGHMPQIIGDLFQRPASLAGTMRKIMAQIMKRESSDEFPFLVVGLPLEAPEPLVNAIFGETRTPLGRKPAQHPRAKMAFPRRSASFSSRLCRTNRWSGDRMRGANTCCALISTPRVGLRIKACFSSMSHWQKPLITVLTRVRWLTLYPCSLRADRYRST